MGLFLTGCSSLANRFILYPSHHEISTPAERIEIPVADAEQVLEAFKISRGPAQAPRRLCILVFGGNGARAEYMPQYTLQTLQSWLDGRTRIEIFALQYPGYGVGSSSPTLRGIGTAALASYDHVHTLAAGAPVIIYGRSLGSTAALHVAATHTRSNMAPAGVLLDRPPNLRPMILGQYGWWNLWILAGLVSAGVPASAQSGDLAEQVGDTPALFLLSQNDEIVPYRYQQQVLRAYAGPTKTVELPGVHNDPAFRVAPEELAVGLAWLLEQVPAPRSGDAKALPAKDASVQ